MSRCRPQRYVVMDLSTVCEISSLVQPGIEAVILNPDTVIPAPIAQRCQLRRGCCSVYLHLRVYCTSAVPSFTPPYDIGMALPWHHYSSVLCIAYPLDLVAAPWNPLYLCR